MDNRWIVLTHGDNPVPAAIPGSILAEGGRRGIAWDVLTMDDPLPAIDAFAGVVIMGGVMGVYDRAQIPRLDDEAGLIRDAVEAGRCVFGVCLGAQLLAHALGSRVYRGPVLESGVIPIRVTAEGARDPVTGPVAEGTPFIQRHHDTFDLPAPAVLLASSDAYENQAFRVGSRAYGLGFHPEINGEVFGEWCRRYPDAGDYPEEGVRAASRAGLALIGRYFDTVLAGLEPPDAVLPAAAG